MAPPNIFYTLTLLQQERRQLWQLIEVENMDIVHTSKTNMAVATSIAHIISQEEDLFFGIAVHLGILHCCIVLVVLFANNIKRR